MRKTLSIIGVLFVGGVLTSGCSKSDTANSNANTNTAVAATTQPGPDNSDITRSTDANGVKTETRVFRNNPHISKVVVTTKSGVRTTRVYSRSGEEKEVNSDKNALEETGDAIAGAAGFVADKTVEGSEKAVDAGKTAAEKTKDTAKTVADKTAEGAKNVGEKTAEGAKTVGEKTAEGAKKTGRAIKKAIKP